MIDSGLIVEYIDPQIWANLKTIIEPFINRGRILHILSDKNGKFRGVTSDHCVFSLDGFTNGKSINTQKIFENCPDINEIREYTLSGLESYYRTVQGPEVYNMDIDDYLVYLYDIQENTDGIRIYKRDGHLKRCYMELIKSFVRDDIVNSIVFIWLTDKNDLFFNCILEFSKGKLKSISTHDRYTGAEKKFDVIYSLIVKEYKYPIISINMELDEFIRKVKENFRLKQRY